MSIKSKVLAGAAALSVIAGAAGVAATSANAATPSCGHGCIDVFSRLFGTQHHPNFVLDVYKQRARTGQPVILFRASNSDQAEDFTVSLQGTVNDFYRAGLASAALNLHYGSLPAYEIEYAPYGAGTGLCVGLGSTAADGTKVSLQPCGASSKTVWVQDSAAGTAGSYAPLVNGSDTNFSHPFVLDYPASGYPTDRPRPQLQTWGQLQFSDGTLHDNQLWSYKSGAL